MPSQIIVRSQNYPIPSGTLVTQNNDGTLIPVQEGERSHGMVTSVTEDISHTLYDVTVALHNPGYYESTQDNTAGFINPGVVRTSTPRTMIVSGDQRNQIATVTGDLEETHQLTPYENFTYVTRYDVTGYAVTGYDVNTSISKEEREVQSLLIDSGYKEIEITDRYHMKSETEETFYLHTNKSIDLKELPKTTYFIHIATYKDKSEVYIVETSKLPLGKINIVEFRELCYILGEIEVPKNTKQLIAEPDTLHNTGIGYNAGHITGTSNVIIGGMPTGT